MKTLLSALALSTLLSATALASGQPTKTAFECTSPDIGVVQIRITPTDRNESSTRPAFDIVVMRRDQKGNVIERREFVEGQESTNSFFVRYYEDEKVLSFTIPTTKVATETSSTKCYLKAAGAGASFLVNSETGATVTAPNIGSGYVLKSTLNPIAEWKLTSHWPYQYMSPWVNGRLCPDVSPDQGDLKKLSCRALN